MQQFIVPQFIDVEDKIIGPITTRQFIILLVGFIIIGICYKLFDFSLFVTISIIILALTGTIAFFKINGRPFHYFILNVYQTLKRSRLRVWNQSLSELDAEHEIDQSHFGPAGKPPLAPKHYAISRLAELSLIVDTKGVYQGEKDMPAV